MTAIGNGGAFIVYEQWAEFGGENDGAFGYLDRHCIRVTWSRDRWHTVVQRRLATEPGEGRGDTRKDGLHGRDPWETERTAGF